MNSGYIKPVRPGVYKVRCRACLSQTWHDGWAKFDGFNWYQREESAVEAEKSIYASLVSPEDREWEYTKETKPSAHVPFWIVKTSVGTLTFQFKSHAEALKKAEQLAGKHPGQTLYVLQAVNVVQAPLPVPVVTKL